MRRERLTKKYFRMNGPSEPEAARRTCGRQFADLVSLLSVSTRTSLYCAPQFGHSNGVVLVTGMTWSGLRRTNLLQQPVFGKCWRETSRRKNWGGPRCPENSRFQRVPRLPKKPSIPWARLPLGRSVRKRETTSSAHCGHGSGSDGVADESFSKFPYRTRRPMCTGDDGLERLFDPTAILIRDSE